MADLELPADVRPISLAGVFTSQYEIDTLPLLFSSEAIYTEYYDALARKNSHMTHQIEELRRRNAAAREHRARGMWQECIDALWMCVEYRKDLFDPTDFQLTAAQRHYIMTLLNFATYFLREGGNGRTAGEEAMFFRSFGLFKRAEETVTMVDDRADRMLLKAMVENNYAAYYSRRRKHKAASQRMASAIKAFNAYINAKNAAATTTTTVGVGGGGGTQRSAADGRRAVRAAAGDGPNSSDDSDADGGNTNTNNNYRKKKGAAEPANMSDAEFKDRTEALYFALQGGTSDIHCGKFEEGLKKLLAVAPDAQVLQKAVDAPFPEHVGETEDECSDRDGENNNNNQRIKYVTD